MINCRWTVKHLIVLVKHMKIIIKEIVFVVIILLTTTASAEVNVFHVQNTINPGFIEGPC